MSDHEGDELGRELRRRSREVDGSVPIDLGRVRQQARRIRRRRQVAAGAAALVVLAVAVPIGLSTTGGETGSQSPVARPSQSVSPALPRGAAPLTAVRVRQGHSPRIGYLDGRTFHAPDGRTVRFGTSYVTVTPYHGGFLAAADHNGTGTVDRIDNALTVTSRTAGSTAFGVSGDQLETAFVLSDPRPRLYSGSATGMGEGEASLRLPAGAAATPVGYVAPGQVVYNLDGPRPQARSTTPSGSSRRLRPFLKAGGATELASLVSGQLSSSASGSCWGVLKVDSNTLLWRTCRHRLGKFSADGRFLLAGPSYGDGLGDASVTILDVRDGSVLAAFARPRGSDLFVADAVWEDAGTVLAVVHESGAWRILRLSVTGGVEAATAPVPGDDTRRPFHFAATP